jgi:hypothetical protein
MAIDAGTIVWSSPAAGVGTTEASAAIAGNVTSTGVKASFVAAQPMDVYEVGAVIGTATAATTYNFTVAVDEKIGGTLASSGSNFATVTGPAATIIPGGSTLKKFVKMRVPKGGVLVFTVLATAPASGTAMFYAIVSPAGAPVLGIQAAAGGLGVGSPPVINEIISTT